jgi:hypothetical protein
LEKVFKIKPGIYYLGDAGYGLKPMGKNKPRNKEEFLSLRHASLSSAMKKLLES